MYNSQQKYVLCTSVGIRNIMLGRSNLHSSTPLRAPGFVSLFVSVSRSEFMSFASLVLVVVQTHSLEKSSDRNINIFTCCGDGTCVCESMQLP